MSDSEADRRDEAPLGRREYDGAVSAATMLAIERALAESRHVLRNEISALAAQVTAGNLQATREHAEVRAALDAIVRDIANLRQLARKVSDLEEAEKVEQARDQTRSDLLSKLDKNRRWMIGLMVSLAGVIVAAVAAVLATH